MKPFDAALAKMRKICLTLPETKETPTWGQPHFRVGEKIFAGLGEEKGTLTIGFKLEKDLAEAIIRRPGFSRAPYVGQHGWVSLDVGTVRDWSEIRDLVHESYRLIAPKKTLALWQDPPKRKAPATSSRNRSGKAPRRRASG